MTKLMDRRNRSIRCKLITADKTSSENQRHNLYISFYAYNGKVMPVRHFSRLLPKLRRPDDM